MEEKLVYIPKKKGGNPNPKGRPSKRPPLENLAHLYSVFTAQEIADLYGVKLATVRSWIARARRNYKDEMAAAEEKYPQRDRKGIL